MPTVSSSSHTIGWASVVWPQPAKLSLLSFNHTKRRLGWYDPSQAKARRFVQLTKLFCCSLASTRHNQHVQIDEFAEVRLAGFGNYGFNQNQFSVLRQRAMTVLHDPDGLFVIPIMNDPFHHNRVAAFRY